METPHGDWHLVVPRRYQCDSFVSPVQAHVIPHSKSHVFSWFPLTLGTSENSLDLLIPIARFPHNLNIYLDFNVARAGSSLGRSSFKNLRSVENMSYLVNSGKGTNRIFLISGDRGRMCPELSLARKIAKPSCGAQRK